MNTNKKLSFSVDDYFVDEDSNSHFAILNMKVASSGMNLHKLPIKKEAIINSARSLFGKPVLAFYDESNDDFLGHENDELAVGVILDENPSVEEDEEGKSWLSTKAYIWKKYFPEVLGVFKKKDGKTDISMEIEVSDSSIENDGYEWINAFSFLGVTLLGVTPAIPGAQATVLQFSEIVEKAKEEFSSRYDDLDFTIPAGVKRAAQTGLDLRKEYGRGGTSVGLATARYLVKNKVATPEKINHISKYFPRHAGDNLDDKTSNGWIAWCLREDTEVTMADGTLKTIGEICRNRIEDEVLSYNVETGEIEKSKITNWFINDSSEEEFIQLGRNKQNRRGLSDKTFVFATKEHPFFTEEGWIPAEEMSGKNMFYLDKLPSSDLIQVLLGTLLGDSSIDKYGRLVFTHSEKQESYLREKARLLNSLSINITSNIANKGYSKGKRYFSARSSVSSFLIELRKDLYSFENKNKKQISADLLNNLTDLAIAFWIMDDGSLHLDNRAGDEKYSYRLHTEGFDDESISRIVNFFNSRNYFCNPLKRENTDGYAIYFTREGSRNLAKAIAPYVHDSMRYKIPENFKNVEYSIDLIDTGEHLGIFPSLVSTFEKASNIKDRHRKKTKMLTKKYNITVEGNNNFFANGILTHNCLWGGNAGRSWSTKLVKKMNELDEKQMAMFSYEENDKETKDVSEKNMSPEDNNKEEELDKEKNKKLDSSSPEVLEKFETEAEAPEETEEKMSAETKEEDAKEEEKFEETEEEEDKSKSDSSEEKTEDEGEEDVKMSDAAYADIPATMSMLGEETEEMREMASLFECKDKDFAKISAAMYSVLKNTAQRMSQMREEREKEKDEFESLKKFKSESEQKWFSEKVENVVKEVKDFMAPTELETWIEKSKTYSFETIEDWEKEIKVHLFSVIKDKGKEKEEINIRIPFSHITTNTSKKYIW